MNRTVLANIIRFILIILIQVLILKSINLNSGNFHFFHFMLYPVLILLLPIDMSRAYVLLIAFGLGLTIDIFYNSPGLHAAAIVFMAYMRGFVLKWLEPRGGYTQLVPGLGNIEFSWFISYAGILMFIFCITYFSLEAFSFVYIIKILLNTFFSFIVSLGLVIIYQMIFRTRF